AALHRSRVAAAVWTCARIRPQRRGDHLRQRAGRVRRRVDRAGRARLPSWSRRRMNRLDRYNAAALLLAICGCLLAAAKIDRGADVRVEQVAPSVRPISEVDLGGGKRGVRDASGAVAPLKTYARVASASLVAADVPGERVEPA